MEMYISFIVLGIGEERRDGLLLMGLFFYMALILWGGFRPYKRMYFSQILAIEINSLTGKS